MSDEVVKTVESPERLALLSSPIRELRNVGVEREGMRLVLRGTVASFYHKQLAQEVVGAVSNGSVAEIENRIEVAPTRRCET